MTAGNANGWTEEDTGLLVEFWAIGLSGGQIVARFGGRFTRSAILGKVHRLGLTRANPGPPSPLERVAPVPANPVPPPASPERAPVSAVASKPARPTAVRCQEVRAPVKSVPLEELRPNHCRWPLGDPMDRPPYRNCGDTALETKPYCLTHCKLAYQVRQAGEGRAA